MTNEEYMIEAFGNRTLLIGPRIGDYVSCRVYTLREV